MTTPMTRERLDEIRALLGPPDEQAIGLFPIEDAAEELLAAHRYADEQIALNSRTLDAIVELLRPGETLDDDGILAAVRALVALRERGTRVPATVARRDSEALAGSGRRRDRARHGVLAHVRCDERGARRGEEGESMTDGEIEKLRADVERLSAHVSDLQRAVLWLAHGRVLCAPDVYDQPAERARELVSHLVEDHAEGWRSGDGVAWYRVPKNESPCDGRDPECP